jgi:hypothetical protein
MAELTQLESKLGEVIGLARAAQDATSKVAGLPEGNDYIRGLLDQMGKEAAETEKRGEEIAEARKGKKSALEEKARATKAEATEMMRTYLHDDADALDGLEFLIMTEAGELGHVEIAGVMAEKAGEGEVREFLEWARPIQERHVEATRSAALELASDQDPNGTE